MLLRGDRLTSQSHLCAVFIAVANFAIDLHWAHPIPHGGVSLHWTMHSTISTAEQALSPLLSVVLSVSLMALLLVGHRALSDLSERSQQEPAKEKKSS